MITLADIKTEKENKVSQLIKESLMFFAFSNEQFAANKTKLEEGEKYLSLGAGAYLPKGKLNTYLNGIKEINKWYKAAIKESKLRKENILYELNNHEAFYTGEIGDTVNALGSDYSETEVMAVFKSEQR